MLFELLSAMIKTKMDVRSSRKEIHPGHAYLIVEAY